MKTDAIYKSKRKLKGGENRYVYTFSKSMMRALHESHPEAVSLLLCEWGLMMKQNFGINATISYDQKSELDRKFLPLLNALPQRSIDVHFIIKWFQNGVRLMDNGLFEDLRCINHFFNTIIPLKGSI